MGTILSGLMAAIGVWMVVTPWTDWYSSVGSTRYLAVALGVLILILATVQLLRRAPGRIITVDWMTLAVGAVLLITGIFLPDRGAGARASEVICGLLVVGIAWLAVHLPRTRTTAKMISIEGQVLLEMKEVIADKRGIGMKGKLMGAMPATIYLRPDEIWNVIGMIPASVVFAVLRELALPRRRPAAK